MVNGSDNKKDILISTQVVAHLTYCSTDLVRKVKRGERKDRRGIVSTMKEVKEFFDKKRIENFNKYISKPEETL